MYTGHVELIARSYYSQPSKALTCCFTSSLPPALSQLLSCFSLFLHSLFISIIHSLPVSFLSVDLIGSLLFILPLSHTLDVSYNEALSRQWLSG